MSNARTSAELREHALQIWRAGVAGVDPRRLISEHVQVDGDWLVLGDNEVPLAEVDRICVVGGGKAGAGMVAGLEAVLGEQVATRHRLAGLVSVPADCVTPMRWIELIAGRQAGVNEPTEAGVTAVRRMLSLVGSLGPRDLCVCLLSGGGSALLPAPIAGFSLADKIALTRLLSAAGASILDMNAVRRELSDVKGGGLARACRAGRLASLIISDVPGDDLEAIASGPTVLCEPAPERAITVLEGLRSAGEPVVQRAIQALRDKGRVVAPAATSQVTNLIIGNNAAAVDAAGIEAERLGYSHAMTSATAPEGPAEDVGRRLADLARQMRDEPGPDCLISGGEPTVTLPPPELRGRGGRNQQLCLAALDHLADWHGMALVSGGTDGEDGPTDAAGALVDEPIARAAHRLRLSAPDHLARCDAYPFFDQTGGLLKTGPTHTNVCDLRVVTVARRAGE